MPGLTNRGRDVNPMTRFRTRMRTMRNNEIISNYFSHLSRIECSKLNISSNPVASSFRKSAPENCATALAVAEKTRNFSHRPAAQCLFLHRVVSPTTTIRSIMRRDGPLSFAASPSSSLSSSLRFRCITALLSRESPVACKEKDA